MVQVKVFFVKGDLNTIVGKTIATWSKGQYTHTAIEILDGTLEALGEIVKDKNGNDILPGVRLSELGKYDNRTDVLTKFVNVPDIAGANEVARKLIGTPYGYIDCAEGGIFDQTGVALPDDGWLTADCSKTVALVLRGGRVTILPDVPAGDITPMDDLNALGGE